MKIPLSLSRNYVCDWTVENAVRELLQNAKDTDNYEIYFDYGLRINSYGGTIPQSYLLLGEGSKTRGGKTLGGCNEGLKLAMLVLCREGITLTMYNGNEKWTPTIEYNDMYKADCLHVEVSECDDVGGVEIYLEDLDDRLLENIRDNTLFMQEDYNKHVTDSGEILLDEQHKGKIFVGGLFVDNYKSDYGFNFNPENFPLDRDRRSLRPFDIEWQTQYMWDEVQSRDEAAEDVLGAIVRRDESFNYAHVTNLSDNLKNKVEDLYKEKYCGKLVVSSMEEYEDEKKAGNDVEYVTNEKLVRIIHQTDSYQSFKVSCNEVEKKSAEDIIYDFKEKWGDDMSSDMYFDFEIMEEQLRKFI